MVVAGSNNKEVDPIKVSAGTSTWFASTLIEAVLRCRHRVTVCGPAYTGRSCGPKYKIPMEGASCEKAAKLKTACFIIVK